MVVLVSTARAEEPSARSLKKCPYGHAALIDVKIIYGTPPFEGPSAEKWNEGIKNLQFASGGCERSQDSPKHQVTCTICRFTHSVFSTDYPEEGKWSRDSTNPNDFPTPISDLVKSFPVIAQGKLEVFYSQDLNDNLSVDGEFVSYDSDESLEGLKRAVTNWLKRQNIDGDLKEKNEVSPSNGVTYKSFEWRSQNFPFFSISIDNSSDRKESSVHAYFSKAP